MKRLFVICCLALCLTACAEENKQIVVPVAGFGGTSMATYNQKKAEMLQMLQNEFPKLKPNVIQAMDSIPRMFFVNDVVRHRSYEDLALPIGSNQATLKPSEIGFLLSEIDLQPTDSVLEIGTGTGYLASVMSRLADQIYSVEIIEYLSELARGFIERLQIENVKLKNANGLKGWDRYAPFDVIIVTAAVKEWPEPLVEQLKMGGKIAAPFINEEDSCEWILAVKTETGLEEFARRKTNIAPAINDIDAIDADKL